MPTDWTVALAIALGVIILLWFALGTQWNVSKGQRVMRWLQDGLPLIGERTTLRWYGSSAIHLTIAKAKDPFREAEVMVVLEPRDVSLLWLLARLRGRRDLMIVRGRLRRPPRFEMELADPQSWTGREALDQMRRSTWSTLPSPIDGRGVGGEGLTLLYQGSEAAERAPELLDRLRPFTPSLARLSFRRSDTTQFQVHLGLPDIKQADARALFHTVTQIARDVMES
jgi:hypothetical protein